MPYIKEVCRAGATIEVVKRFSPRYGKKSSPRGPNENPTPQAMEAVNRRQAETRLRRLLNTNFGYKDIHLVLTYRRDERPDPETAQKYLTKFLRDLRKLYKSEGRELKYIAATEYEQTAIHHHLVINSIDTRLLPDIWPHGQPRPTYLDNTGNYSKLAHYLIKETSKTFSKPDSPMKKRYQTSRNLDKPVITRTEVNARIFSKTPKAFKGYALDKDSLFDGVHELTGMRYQFYSMTKMQQVRRC